MAHHTTKGGVRPYLRIMFWKRILYYLNPSTLFSETDHNTNLRFMHGINRISIFVFLACMVVLVLRAFMR